MITVRRARERHHVQRNRQDAWLTFHPDDRADPLASGFGALEILKEDIMPPGAGVWLYSQPDVEIVTYVLEGTLAQKDAGGSLGILRSGEFQRMSARHGVRHSAVNPSEADRAHVFQMWLRPGAGLEPGYEQRRFSAAERRGALCVVGSPDGRKHSLRLHADALVYSALLDAGQHLVHELAPQRIAWLHIVRGEVALFDHVLAAGDGVGATSERALSLTAGADTEILLLDLGEEPPTLADERTSMN